MTSFIKVRLKKINYNLWNINTWKAFEHRYCISAESKWNLFQVSKCSVNMAKFTALKSLLFSISLKGIIFSLSLNNRIFLKIINLLPRIIISYAFETCSLIQNQEGKWFFHSVLLLQCNCHIFVKFLSLTAVGTLVLRL